VLREGQESSFRNYVLRGALNRLSDFHRRSRHEVRNADAILEAIAAPASRTGDPVESDDNRQRMTELLYDAIASLDDPYGPIFRLLLAEDLSLAEIARRLKISQGSIYV